MICWLFGNKLSNVRKNVTVAIKVFPDSGTVAKCPLQELFIDLKVHSVFGDS